MTRGFFIFLTCVAIVVMGGTSSQAAATEGAAGDTVSAQVTPAEVTFVQPSSGMQVGQNGFGARWPEKLPDAQDLRAQDPERSEPPPPSNSYAENHTGTDVARTPLRWPVVETSRAEPISNVETVLRSFSIAGGLLLVALLLAGWAARFIRGPGRWHSPDRRHPVAAEVDPAAFAVHFRAGSQRAQVAA